MKRRSTEDVVVEVLVRLFNTCLGAGLGYSLAAQGRGLLLRELLPTARPTALAIMTGAGALVGLIWGKAIWAAIDRQFHGGWASKPRSTPDDDDDDERARRKRKTP